MTRRSVPAWAWFLSGLAVLLVAGPLTSLLLAMPWADLATVLAAPEVGRSLGLSLGTSAVATLVTIVLGGPLSYLLARRASSPGWRGRVVRGVQGLVLVPLVLSPVVSGLAMIYFWGRRGPAGQALGALGLDVGFSPTAVVLVQVFVSLPFFVAAGTQAFAATPRELSEAAVIDGAGPTKEFWHIQVPLALPGLVVGTLLAFARSLGEYGATITFAGSIDGVTRTMPLQIELSLGSGQPETALGVALLLVGSYAVLLLAIAAARLRRGPLD